MKPAAPRATLVLEDGSAFEGRSFGRQGETTGEVVFNTALCGYQEVLTDPSYAGQIVTMTYPHIGNYGVNLEDVESVRPQVAGFVVREASTLASSWRASGELHRYLDEAGRRRHQRDRHPRPDAPPAHARAPSAGVISTVRDDRDGAAWRRRARSRSMIGLDLAREVTCAEPFRFDVGARRETTRSAWWPTTSG